MRKHKFGFTIAKRFLGLTPTTVFLFMLFGVMAEAERVDLVQPTSRSKEDTTDEAEMSAQATMHAWYEEKGTIYEVHSRVSSDVYAGPESTDKEYNCTAWIKGTADQFVKAIYPTENLKLKKKADSEGREYHEGRYKSSGGVAYSGIKKHPVSHVTVSATQERTRSLVLYDDGSYYDLVYSPSQRVSSRARAEVKGVARNNASATLAHFWAEVESGG